MNGHVDHAESISQLCAGLAPISLDDVERRAALLTRVDRKYALRTDRALDLLAVLGARSAVLTIDDRHLFWYRSVYFDTPDLESYRQTAHARRHRFKVRTRTYVETGRSYLEVKVRRRRGVTEKVRIEVAPGTTDHLDDDGRRFVDDRLGRPGLGELLRPACTTEYQRTTLVDLDSTTRATIDTSLALGGVDAPGLVVVETKGASGVSWYDRQLWDAGARPCSVSKFGLAMAAGHPDLAANRWSRVLREHLHLRPLSLAEPALVSPSSARATR